MKKTILGVAATLTGSVGIALGQARLGMPHAQDAIYTANSVIHPIQALETVIHPIQALETAIHPIQALETAVDSLEKRLPPVIISTEPPPELEAPVPYAQARTVPLPNTPPTTTFTVPAPKAPLSAIPSAPTLQAPVSSVPMLPAPTTPQTLPPHTPVSAYTQPPPQRLPMGTTVESTARLYQAQPPAAPAPLNPPILTIETSDGPRGWTTSSEGAHSRFSIGASLVVVRPAPTSNTAYSTFVRTDNGLGAATGVDTATEFKWQYQPGVAAWLAWQNSCGWGMRSRYFYLDGTSPNLVTTVDALAAQAPPIGQGKQVTAPSFGLPGNAQGFAQFGSPGFLLANAALGRDVLTFNSDLAVHSVPIEATYKLGSGGWSFIVAGGAHYLNLEQGYTATLFNPGDFLVNQEAQQLTFQNSFHGWGPTFAAETAFQVGHTQLFLFGNARGSCLIGTAAHDARFQQVVTGIAAQTTFTERYASNALVVPVTELELGLAYGVSYRRTLTVFRGGVVNQTYFQTGSATSESGNLNLFGWMMSMEVKF